MRVGSRTLLLAATVASLVYLARCEHSPARALLVTNSSSRDTPRSGIYKAQDPSDTQSIPPPVVPVPRPAGSGTQTRARARDASIPFIEVARPDIEVEVARPDTLECPDFQCPNDGPAETVSYELDIPPHNSSALTATRTYKVTIDLGTMSDNPNHPQYRPPGYNPCDKGPAPVLLC